MNILFVDSSNNKLKFGFDIKKIKGRKIYSLKISNNINVTTKDIPTPLAMLVIVFSIFYAPFTFCLIYMCI